MVLGAQVTEMTRIQLLPWGAYGLEWEAREGDRAAVIRREMPFPVYSLGKCLVSSYCVPSDGAGTEGVGWVLG